MAALSESGSEPGSAPMKPLSMPALIMTSIYTLGVNAVWLSYNIFILPVQVQAVTTEATKGIVLGTLVGVAIGIASIVNIVAGIISDHTNSRFGRRRPMMTWGMLLTLPFLLIPLFLPLTLLTVSLSYLGMQVCTNISSGAFQPTLADFIPEAQRGISAGFKGVFILIGSAIGVGVITGLFAANLENVAYVLLAGIFFATTMLNVYAMRAYDKPMPDLQPVRLRFAIIDMFRVRKSSGVFFWFVFASFLIYMGASAFQFFAVYYIEGILHITKQADVDRAIQIAGVLNLTISMVFALVAGILSDRLGRRNIIIFSSLVAAIVGLFFPFARTFAIFLFFSAFYAGSNGVILSVDTALTSDLVPLEEAGKYMAYANLAQGVGNGIAPPIFGLILNAQGAPTIGSFVAFFVVSSAFFAISCLVMWLKVPKR